MTLPTNLRFTVFDAAKRQLTSGSPVTQRETSTAVTYDDIKALHGQRGAGSAVPAWLTLSPPGRLLWVKHCTHQVLSPGSLHGLFKECQATQFQVRKLPSVSRQDRGTAGSRNPLEKPPLGLGKDNEYPLGLRLKTFSVKAPTLLEG